MTEREALIASGLLRPGVGDGVRLHRAGWQQTVAGDPSPELERDVPTLRLDRIGRVEAERAVSSSRYARGPT